MIEVLTAIVGGVALVLVAVVGTVGAKINGRVRAVQGQVQNDHPMNLRDELDSRHKETRGWWRETRRDIGGIRQDIRDLRADLARERDRIDDIETTLNPHQKE